MIRISNCEKSLLIISIFSENSKTRLFVKNKEWEELLGVKDTENVKIQGTIEVYLIAWLSF